MILDKTIQTVFHVVDALGESLPELLIDDLVLLLHVPKRDTMTKRSINAREGE